MQRLEQEEKDNEAVSKMMAAEQKNQLTNLFQEKNRPTLTKWPQVVYRPERSHLMCVQCVLDAA